MLCPCKSNIEYQQCCEPIILKKVKAQSPEQLMRSRYSAYAFKHSEYIYETYSNTTKVNHSVKEIDEWANETKWLNLTVLNTSDYQNIEKPTVTFEAIYQHKKTFYKMSETSNFIKENGFWRYIDGLGIEFIELPLPKRNDQCLCLSGKKFKKCCAI